MEDCPRANVLGVGVHSLDMTAAVAATREFIAQGRRGYVCLATVYGIMEAQRDPGLRAIYNCASLCLPDGMPTVWMGWLQGRRSMDRVYGPDFMLRVLESGVESGLRHFLYGGLPGVADELKRNLERMCPGVSIVGTFAPPFRPLTEDEERSLASHVSATKTDIMWVGIGSPKQERFCSNHVDRLDVPLLIGVGAAFDIHTGRHKDAPNWVKRAGIQWAHRLLQDPRRLAGRYIVNNPLFVALAAAQLLGLRRYKIYS